MELVNTAKRFDELRDLNVIVYIEDHFDSKGRKINYQYLVNICDIIEEIVYISTWTMEDKK